MTRPIRIAWPWRQSGHHRRWTSEPALRDGAAAPIAIPLIAGGLWDATGLAVLAFAPGILAAGAMAWGAMSLRMPERVQGSG